MNPTIPKDLLADADSWGDESINLIHTVDGAYLYEVHSHNGIAPVLKRDRYAVAWLPPDEDRWTAFDATDVLFSGGIHTRGLTNNAREILGNLFSLIP